MEAYKDAKDHNIVSSPQEEIQLGTDGVKVDTGVKAEL